MRVCGLETGAVGRLSRRACHSGGRLAPTPCRTTRPSTPRGACQANTEPAPQCSPTSPPPVVARSIPPPRNRRRTCDVGSHGSARYLASERGLAVPPPACGYTEAAGISQLFGGHSHQDAAFCTGRACHPVQPRSQNFQNGRRGPAAGGGCATALPSLAAPSSFARVSSDSTERKAGSMATSLVTSSRLRSRAAA